MKFATLVISCHKIKKWAYYLMYSGSPSLVKLRVLLASTRGSKDGMLLSASPSIKVSFKHLEMSLIKSSKIRDWTLFTATWSTGTALQNTINSDKTWISIYYLPFTLWASRASLMCSHLLSWWAKATAARAKRTIAERTESIRYIYWMIHFQN